MSIPTKFSRHRYSLARKLQYKRYNGCETRWPTSGTISPLTAVDNLTTETNSKLCPFKPCDEASEAGKAWWHGAITADEWSKDVPEG